MIDLTNKTAFVTGASSEIGHSIAKLLHSLGAYIILSGRDENKLQSLSDELKSRNEIVLMDLRNTHDIKRIIQVIERVDILILNAGIISDSIVLNTSHDSFVDVMNVNLVANFEIIKYVAKGMIKRKYGRIIAISSVVAFLGNIGQVSYSASKAGLVGMIKTLALELARYNITANCIVPGLINSGMSVLNLTNEQIENIIRKIPMQKMGSVIDIANLVAFIASDLSGYITGQLLHVNGGMSL